MFPKIWAKPSMIQAKIYKINRLCKLTHNLFRHQIGSWSHSDQIKLLFRGRWRKICKRSIWIIFISRTLPRASPIMMKLRFRKTSSNWYSKTQTVVLIRRSTTCRSSIRCKLNRTNPWHRAKAKESPIKRPWDTPQTFSLYQLFLPLSQKPRSRRTSPLRIATTIGRCQAIRSRVTTSKCTQAWWAKKR